MSFPIITVYFTTSGRTLISPTPCVGHTNFLAKRHLPSLTDEQLQMLNAPFTGLEISKSIQSLPTGKAPGPDGMLNEYYNLFANTLIPHLNPVFTKAMHTQHLPLEMLKAQMVTLPKPGKDPTTPAYFCPILLLNTDVNFFSQAASKRFHVYTTHINQKRPNGIRQWEANFRRNKMNYKYHTFCRKKT